MASQIIHGVDKSKLATYAMIVFLRCPQLSVSIDNFTMLMHVYCLLEVNAFGVSAPKTQVRAGTGLYAPTNLIDHSCKPNCAVVFRGREQFIVATKLIKAGEPISISYIDPAIEDSKSRRWQLQHEYYFTCDCDRCDT